jgi:hypothetical protein
MFRKLITGLIIILAGYSSCEVFPKVKCSECTSLEPDSADLKMLFTINAENPKVPLVVYKGKVEEGNVEWTDTTNNETLYLYVQMNQFYSVVAKYKSGTHTIYAVDGDKIRTVNETDNCNQECYIVTNNELDIRLKE